MLNNLPCICLLIERGRNSIRDVALQILQESSSIIVKAGAQLRELWKVDRELVRVSLMKNQIEDIHSSPSPKCPFLLTPLLRYNGKLQFIADS